MLCNQLCASSPPRNESPSSSITRVGCIMYHESEEYNVHITPLQGGVHRLLLLFSSPPHNGVGGLLLVQMKIRSRTLTPSQGGEEVLCWLLVARIQ